jgi:hypothetical protein
MKLFHIVIALVAISATYSILGFPLPLWGLLIVILANMGVWTTAVLLLDHDALKRQKRLVNKWRGREPVLERQDQ